MPLCLVYTAGLTMCVCVCALGFYASAVLPLWADAVDPTLRDEATRTRMLEALAPYLTYPCGVPTSEYECLLGPQRPNPAVHAFTFWLRLCVRACVVGDASCTSGQQWDMPNAWPPLQLFMIEGLRRLQLPAGSDTPRASHCHAWGSVFIPAGGRVLVRTARGGRWPSRGSGRGSRTAMATVQLLWLECHGQRCRRRGHV
jgi:hypothetical protein